MIQNQQKQLTIPKSIKQNYDKLNTTLNITEWVRTRLLAAFEQEVKNQQKTNNPITPTTNQ